MSYYCEIAPACRRDGVAAADGHATNGAAPSVNPATLRPSASARTKLAGVEEAAAGSRGPDAPASSSRLGDGASERGGAAGDRGRARGPAQGAVCLDAGGPHPSAAASSCNRWGVGTWTGRRNRNRTLPVVPADPATGRGGSAHGSKPPCEVSSAVPVTWLRACTPVSYPLPSRLRHGPAVYSARGDHEQLMTVPRLVA